MPVFHALVLFEHHDDALTEFAFQDFYAVVLAARGLASGAIVRRQLCVI